MAKEYYPAKTKHPNRVWDDLTLIDYANEHPTKDIIYEDARCAVNDDILDQLRRKRLRKKAGFRKQFRKEERAQKRLAKKTRKEIQRRTMARVRAKRIRRRFSLSCFLLPFVLAIVWGSIGYILKLLLEPYVPEINPWFLLGACCAPSALYLLTAIKALVFGGRTLGSVLFLNIASTLIITIAPVALIFVMGSSPMDELTAFIEGMKETPLLDTLKALPIWNLISGIGGTLPGLDALPF